MRACDNPFATHRVLQLRFQPQGTTWNALLDRLSALDYRAAIVGPKGSGKTTLLEELAPRLAERDLIPRSLRLDAQHRRFAAGFLRELARNVHPRDILLLDGAEQLGWWGWWRFCQATRRAAGLIVTTHRPGRLPTLLECRATPDLLEQLLAKLLGDQAAVFRETAQALFNYHRGNVREVLRALYDQCATRI